MNRGNFCLFTFYFLLVFQRLLPGFGHVRGIPDYSFLAYGQDAPFPVRSKNERENLRNRVIKFSAGIWRIERTIGTRIKILIDVAGADFAPMLTGNLLTTWAFPFLIFSTGAAI